MATKIFVFDPLQAEGLQGIENELDELLSEEWKIASALSGNRTGAAPSISGGGSVVTASTQRMPQQKDYVVLILHKPNPSELGNNHCRYSPRRVTTSLWRRLNDLEVFVMCEAELVSPSSESQHKFRSAKQLKPHDLPALIIIYDNAGFDFFAFLNRLV